MIAWVKNQQKKREKERLLAVGAETPATPTTPVAPPTPTIVSTPAVGGETSDQIQYDGAGIEPSNGTSAVDEELNVVESVEQPAEAAEPLAAQDVGLPSTFSLTSANTAQNTTTDKPDENDDDEDEDTQSQASDETEIFTGEEQALAQQDDGVEQDQTENVWSNMYDQNYGYNNDANFQGMDFNAMQAMQQQMMLQMQNGGFPNMMG